MLLMAELGGLVRLSLTKKTTYWAIYKGLNLGYFTVDSLAINGEILTTVLEVDQIKNPDARIEYESIVPTIDITMAQDSIDLLYNALLGDMAGFRAGVEAPLFGWGDIDEDASDHAGLLELIPVDQFSQGKRLESFAITNAYLPAQTIALLKGKGRFGTIPVQFKALIDDDAPKKFRYLPHGNLDAEDQAPQGVFITATRRPRPSPSVSLPSIGVAAGTFDRLSAWLFYAADSANTSAINDITDISATDVLIEFDTQVGRQFIVGDVIKIDAEYMFVTELTTTTSITVVREKGGSAGVAHLDGAAITIQQSVFYWLATNIVTWASTLPLKITVGDVVGADDATEKGRITNVAADDATSNITATLTAVPSPICVVKAHI